jgi:uncharacterized membrane protein (Fun14 family)
MLFAVHYEFMQEYFLLYVLLALAAGSLIGFLGGYAVRAAISRRRRRKAMLNRGWL